jgi:hypothetical protein
MTDYLPKLSRRRTLQWMAATSIASALPHGAPAADIQRIESAPVSHAYGTDPNLKHPVVTWSLIMTPHQLQQTAVLADLILPGSADALAPSALGVPDFINEWVSAPYPDQLQDRAIILEGLTWVDGEATRRGQQLFVELDARAQGEILDDIAPKAPAPQFVAQARFFQRLRFLVVGAYYTTPEGFKDIGYVGNVPLASYPPVTDEERMILDTALAKLGLLRA